MPDGSSQLLQEYQTAFPNEFPGQKYAVDPQIKQPVDQFVGDMFGISGFNPRAIHVPMTDYQKLNQACFAVLGGVPFGPTSDAVYLQVQDIIILRGGQEKYGPFVGYMARYAYAVNATHAAQGNTEVFANASEGYTPHGTVVYPQKDGHAGQLTRTRVGLGVAKIDKSASVLRPTEEAYGWFFENGLSNWVAAQYIRSLHERGDESVRTVQRALFDRVLTPGEFTQMKPRLGKYPTEYFQRMPDGVGGQTWGINMESLTGIAFGLLVKHDPRILEFAVGIKKGNVDAFRKFPKAVDALLGEGMYSQLQKMPYAYPESEQRIVDTFAMIYDKLEGSSSAPATPTA